MSIHKDENLKNTTVKKKHKKNTNKKIQKIHKTLRTDSKALKHKKPGAQFCTGASKYTFYDD